MEPVLTDLLYAVCSYATDALFKDKQHWEMEGWLAWNNFSVAQMW